MKQLQIVIFITAILAIAIIAAAEKQQPQQWQYARLNFEPYTDWVWTGPEGVIQTDDLRELFTKLKIPLALHESPTIYIFFSWAGTQNWELVTLEQKMGVIRAWFKRPAQ